jgi:methylmalonyl-CoA mutase N-terminal domain/subunit
MDIFEEIAKLRVGRKMWAELLKSRYGVTDEKAARLRVHALTAGSSMTYQQPMNNIVRGTLMALAGVLGGVQSLGVSGYDESLSVPSEHAHQMSVRIQQILQEETNLTAVADPLGGSYFVESLCAELEQRAWMFFDEIETQGGFLAALDNGWLHDRAHQNQYQLMADMDTGKRKVVGVTDFDHDVSPYEVDGFVGTTDAFDKATERLKELRRTRNGKAAADATRDLEAACRGNNNLMPVMMAAVDADVTLGEIGNVFREVYGDWDTPIMT